MEILEYIRSKNKGKGTWEVRCLNFGGGGISGKERSKCGHRSW